MPRHAGLTEDVTRRVEDFVVVLLTAAVLRLHRAAHELATKSPLRLLGTAEGQRSLANASLLVQRFAGVSAEPVLAEPGEAGVEAAAEGARAARAGAGGGGAGPPRPGPARLLVVGLPERWRQEGLGPTRSQIART